MNPIEPQAQKIINAFYDIDKILDRPLCESAEVIIKLSPERHPETSVRMQFHNFESDFFKKVTEAMLGKAVEIARFFVKMPE